MKTVAERLQENIRARIALSWLATPDEESCLPVVRQAAEDLGYVVFEWDCIHGFTYMSQKEVRQPPNDGTTNIERALDVPVTYAQERALFIYKDFDLTLERIQQQPAYVTLVRRLKELSRSLKTGDNAVVLMASSPVVPQEISSFVSLVEDPYPTAEELEGLTRRWLSENGLNDRCELDREGIYRLARAGRGMTASQFQTSLARSMVRRGKLCGETIDDVLDDKVELIRKTEVLELIQWQEGMEDVGGCRNLKEWLRKRATWGSQAAESYGLPAPRGVLLVGISGTGKSLTVKALGKFWKLPVLRLDVGRIYGSYVGQSEARLRQALRLVESMAPCILWIDEIDKGLGGTTQFAGDGGLSQRILGALLTWMQERRGQSGEVFIAATANDVRGLRPELLRPGGRFDQVFFLDLPREDERPEIIGVHLRKYGRDPAGLVTHELIAKTDRFTGADLEAVVVEALYRAFDDGIRPLTKEDLLAASVKVTPIADRIREEVEELRRWGKTHAQPAS